MTPHFSAIMAAPCRESHAAKAIRAELAAKCRETCKANSIAPMVEMHILERSMPDKPRSRMQRHITIETGLAILGTHQGLTSFASRRALMLCWTRR